MGDTLGSVKRLVADPMTTRRTIKLIHQGRYAAEVPIELIEDDSGWSPYLPVADAAKLDAVRRPYGKET